MFSYCLNNPINYADQAGKNAASAALPVIPLALLPLLDGPIPVGDIIALVGFAALSLYQQVHIKEIISGVSTERIDWNGGDKNHILKGTKKKHVQGWKRFGIDPDDNNAWGMLLPILKEVIEKADDVVPHPLSDGSMFIEYFKTYLDKGVEVVVRIWVDASGAIQKISDAIPYIIDS